MQIRFLGTGTSDGIPTFLCSCPVCTSPNPANKRLRSSLLITKENYTVLFDTPPDMRYMLLRYRIPDLDAVFYTHPHYDHIAGLDDLRSHTLINKKPLEIYIHRRFNRDFKRRFHHIFHPLQTGGGIIKINYHNFRDYTQIKAGPFCIKTLPVWHGKLEITAYLVNNKVAYINDVSMIPEAVFAALGQPEILILDMLRIRPHSTHFNFEQALDAARKIGAGKTYFTHIAHEIEHEKVCAMLPAGMELARDGMVIDL
ncbi:MAG TPA: MBL fold metallo-hydrolase [Spirochaetia bacterium]|nr:MBL fold metallo-hydrolase [Spirochaetia bacterium]